MVHKRSANSIKSPRLPKPYYEDLARPIATTNWVEDVTDILDEVAEGHQMVFEPRRAMGVIYAYGRELGNWWYNNPNIRGEIKTTADVIKKLIALRTLGSVALREVDVEIEDFFVEQVSSVHSPGYSRFDVWAAAVEPDDPNLIPTLIQERIDVSRIFAGEDFSVPDDHVNISIGTLVVASSGYRPTLKDIEPLVDLDYTIQLGPITPMMFFDPPSST